MGLTDHLICPLRAAGIRPGIQRGVCHRGKRAYHSCDTRLGSLVESQPPLSKLAFTTGASPQRQNGAKWPSVVQMYHIIMLADVEKISFIKIKVIRIFELRKGHLS